MTDFNPQNLLEQARRLGKSVQDFAEDKAERIVNAVETSANIITNAVNDTVAGSITELESAAVQVENKIPLDYRDVLQFQNAELEKINRLLGIIGGRQTPFPNELRDFASYNYVIGFGVLNTYEINFPERTYRKRDPSVMICKTGGGLGARKATTIYETSGRLEYFLDDLEIESIISMGGKNKQSNATNIDFKIIEPYSMGLFLQTLQIAAMQAGYKNYLEAPYVITIDFKGYDNNGNSISKPMLRRVLPLKVYNIQFDVTEAGSSYTFQSIPYNEQGLIDQVQTVKTDINLTGSTVAELLQSSGFSLMANINYYQQTRAEENQVVQPDEYIVMFPKERSSVNDALITLDTETDTATTDQSLNEGEERELTQEEKIEIYQSITGTEDTNLPADFDADLSKLLGIIVNRSDIGEALREAAENPENINDIGQSQIVQSYLDGGRQPFGRPRFVEETEVVEGVPPNVGGTIGTGNFKRGNITISNNGRTIGFKSGTPIQDIIEEIIILSDYGKKIQETEPDDNGMIPWFRIETQVFLVPNQEHMDQTGTYPKIYVYKIVPYKAHLNRFQAPTESGPGYKKLEKQVCKEYDYIYTGKNDDILDFNIKFDSAFFTAITPFQGEYNMGEQDADAESSGDAEESSDVQPNTGSESNVSSTGNTTTMESTRPETGQNGGGFPDRTATSIARDFNDALVNSNVDLLSANMTIWGDPYYIADSGYGNYNAQETPIINLTEDGTMDYQSSEVDVKINFRTPIDIGSDGSYDFPGLGTRPVGAFSGLYQVLFVGHKFSDGVFTQELRMIRRRNQEGQDTNVPPVTEDNSLYTESTDDGNSGNDGVPGSGASNNGGGTGATASGDQGDGLRG